MHSMQVERFLSERDLANSRAALHYCFALCGPELTAQQEEEVDNLGQIRALFEGRESARKVFRQAMPKTMYWFGTSLLLNHLMEHSSHALARTVPEKLPH